jgi:hypothetical protein
VQTDDTDEVNDKADDEADGDKTPATQKTKMVTEKKQKKQKKNSESEGADVVIHPEVTQEILDASPLARPFWDMVNCTDCGKYRRYPPGFEILFKGDPDWYCFENYWDDYKSCDEPLETGCEEDAPGEIDVHKDDFEAGQEENDKIRESVRVAMGTN